MALPSQVIEKVRRGKVVLFLGSGALHGASLPDGRHIPLGNQLRDILCDEFLTEAFKNDDLAHVGAMAISETSLFDVQDFIKKYFDDLKPADFHEEIPSFKWRAIFTTNYDLLIENVYSNSKSSIQSLNKIMSNEDRIDETRVANDKLPFLKLHGCVSRTHDASLPLILTTDQYNSCYETRSRLFSHLYELAYENTLFFIGHSLHDHNIRNVLLQLEKEAPHGQRHYLFKPGVDDIEKNFWGQKKITAIDCNFKDLLLELAEAIPKGERAISLIAPPSTHPIQSVFSTHSQPSDELVDFLFDRAEWVHPGMAIPGCDASKFFQGENQGWAPVVGDVSINRGLQRRIYEGSIVIPDPKRESETEFVVLKGEAGSGKSVLLRQLAWQISNEGLGVVLWIRDGCSADYDLVQELISKSNERIFIFWDDAAINGLRIKKFLTRCQKEKSSITLITAERYNEWNVRCEELDELVDSIYELKYLSENEITQLVERLETYDSLGPNLIHKDHKGRCNELREIYGRQLLVALHEATMGEPFEDIIFDEYESIFPEDAKRIYLTVATLNRLRVPVRAGLISRIHDISFSEFTEKFHRPLERVVITEGKGDKDIHYYSRHPEIAEIVFRRALVNTEDRYQEYIRIIDKLNISFDSDRLSFRQLIKAKSLQELFHDYEDVKAIYKKSYEAIGDDAYLYQQMANYERIRTNGSLGLALDLLSKARNLAPHDKTILHSLSVVYRDKSEASSDLAERQRLRSEARAYLEQIATRWAMDGYIAASIVELSLFRLKDIMADDSSSEVSIRESIRDVQNEVTKYKRRYPSEAHLHSLESDFARLVEDQERAVTALVKAFEENDREPSLAIRLAIHYVAINKAESAKEVLQKALERRRADHRLNFHYAEILREQRGADRNELMYFYRRAYTPNDSNYRAQFWYARFAFLSNKENERRAAREIFNSLRKARMPHAERHRVRDYEGGAESPTSMIGAIKTKREAFGFITIEGNAYDVFFPASNVDDDLWAAMKEGDRASFKLGYSYTGPVACSIVPV